jgi:hypothetical protein
MIYQVTTPTFCQKVWTYLWTFYGLIYGLFMDIDPNFYTKGRGICEPLLSRLFDRKMHPIHKGLNV